MLATLRGTTQIGKLGCDARRPKIRFPLYERVPGLLSDRGCGVHRRRRLHPRDDDDIINVAGHRLSTGGIEEVLAAHPDVAECAVIGVADALKGQVPLGLLVLKAGVNRSSDEVEREAVQLVRDRIGPVASFKTALVVTGLPKTRSGKILRGRLRRIADGEDYLLPATIDDPAILAEIDATLAKAGYARRMA